jgi:hypothetical protein
VILYRFYKVHLKHTKRVKKPFANRPLKHRTVHSYALNLRQAPRNTRDLAIWPSGLGGGADRGNRGDLAGELGRVVAGEALGVARGWFVCWFWGGRGRR